LTSIEKNIRTDTDF